MGFALEGPTSITVKQGESASAIYRVLATSRPYRGVSLAVSGVPPGVSSTFSPTSGKPTFQAVLRLTASLTAPIGTYTIRVVARDAKGSKTVSTSVFVVSKSQATLVPILSSLVPSSTTEGGAEFTLQVNGFHFLSGAVVYWNGSPRTTAFINSTRVDATITAADIANDGTASVTARNPGSALSNALTFTINPAAGFTYDFYVDGTNGNNSWDGTAPAFVSGSTGPKQTISAGLALLSAGKRLGIRAGSYNTAGVFPSCPSGTDFSSGAVRVSNYNGETVTFTTSSGSHVVQFDGSQHHIIIEADGQDKIVVDGAAGGDEDGIKTTSASHHIRLKNLEVKNATNQGVQLTNDSPGTSGFHEVISCHIHNNGNDTQFEHGVYLWTEGVLIEHCHIHDNAGYGIHRFSEGNNNIVRYNIVHDHPNQYNILIQGGDATPHNHQVYGNITYGTGGAIAMWGVGGDKIANNTFDNGGCNFWNWLAACEFDNNIVLGGLTHDTSSSTANYACRNNLINSVDTQSFMSPNSGNTFGSFNANFVNQGARNYRIAAGTSAAANTGRDTGFTPDPDGVSRPQGAAYDIGAFERVGG